MMDRQMQLNAARERLSVATAQVSAIEELDNVLLGLTEQQQALVNQRLDYYKAQMDKARTEVRTIMDA